MTRHKRINLVQNLSEHRSIARLFAVNLASIYVFGVLGLSLIGVLNRQPVDLTDVTWNLLLMWGLWQPFVAAAIGTTTIQYLLLRSDYKYP